MPLGASPVSVQYSADGSAYTQSMGEMVVATAQFADVADGLVGKVSKAGIALTKAAADTTSFGNSTNIAVRQAAAYQEALSGLETRADAAGKSFKTVGAVVRESARQSPVGLGKTIEQYEMLFDLGVTSEKKLKPLADSLTNVQAATGNLGNTQFSADMLSLGRTFDAVDPGSIDNIADSIVGMTSKVGGSAAGVVSFSKQIAPLSEQLGMTQTSVLGFSNAFSKAGEDGGRAATVYTRMLSDMERSVREGTNGIKDYADAIGLSSEATKELVENNPAEALAQVFDSLSSSNSTDAIRTLERLGLEGPRTLKTITAVTAAGGVRESLQAAGEEYGSGKSLIAAEKALGGINNELKRTQESMSQLVEASGRPAMGVMSGVAKTAAGVSGAAAGAAGSDFMQTIGTALMGASVLGNTLGTGVKAYAGWQGTKQMTKMIPDPVYARMGQGLGWARNNRGMLMKGGAAGLAVGAMTDNPLLSMAGMVALSGSSMVKKGGFMEKAAKGVQRAAGAGMDAVAFDRFTMAGTSLADRKAALAAGLKDAPRWSGVKDAMKSAIPEINQMTGISMKRLSRDFITSSGGLDKEALQKTMEKVRSSFDASVESYKTNTANLVDSNGKTLSSDELNRKATEHATEQSKNVMNEEAKQYRKAKPVDEFRARTRRGVRTAAAGVRASGGALISGALGVAKAHPVAAAAVGIGAVAGAGYLGWKANRDRNERALDLSNSTTKQLSEKYGVALKDMAGLFEDMKSSVSSVASWQDAYKMDPTLVTRMKASGEKPKWELTERQKSDADKGDVSELVQSIRAIAGAQGPQFTHQMLLDLAAQTSAQTAEQVAEGLETEGMGTTADIADAVSRITDTAGTGYGGRGFWGQTVGLFSNDYTGKEEALDLGASAGQQSATIIAQKESVGGERAGAKARIEVVTALYDSVSPGDDVDLDVLTADMRAAGFTASETEKIIEGVRGKLAGRRTGGEAETTTTALKAAIQTGGDALAPVKGKAPAGGQYGGVQWAKDDTGQYGASLGVGATEPQTSAERAEALLPDISEVAQKPIDNSAVLKLQESNDFISNQYAKIAELSNEMSLSPEMLLDLWNEGEASAHAKEESVQVAFEAYKNESGKADATIQEWMKSEDVTQRAVTVSQAVVTPGSAGAAVMAEEEYFGRGQSAQEMVRGAGRALELEPEEGLSGKHLSMINAAMSRQLPVEQAGMSAGDQLQSMMGIGEATTDVANAMLAVNEHDEKAAELLKRGNEQKDAALIGQTKRLQGYLQAQFNYQKNSSRAWEDFYEQEEYARDDYNLQAGRANEDHHLQVQRAEEDFAQQTARNNADFRRGQRREQADFDLQMIRAAEDTAKQIMDPFTRSTTKQTWSGSGLAQNLKEQNKEIAQQQEQLAELHERGLSKQAIEQLQLADSSNARQVVSLSGMTRKEIEDINKQASRRGTLSGRAVDSEFNTGTKRAQEDFAKQQGRASDDFGRQQRRSERDFKKSLGRSADDLARNLDRSFQDMERGLGRQAKSLKKQLRRSKNDINDQMKGISADYSEMITAISELNETGTTEWNEITGSGLDQITGKFDRSGANWEGSTHKTINAVNKQLKSFSTNGSVADKVLNPKSTGKKAYTPVNNRSTNAPSGGGWSAGATSTPVGGGGSGGYGGKGGEVTSAGSPNDSWKDEFTSKQDKLIEGLEKYGPLGGGGTLGSFKGSVSDFPRSPIFGEANMTAAGTNAGRSAASLWGDQLDSIGGYRPSDPYPDHPSGNAVDIMIPNYNTDEGRALGDEIADFYLKNAAAFNVDYMIWRQRSNRGDGWSKMGDRGGDTANHYDHIHLMVGDGKAGRVDTTSYSKKDMDNMSIWEIGDAIWEQGKARETAALAFNDDMGNGRGDYSGGTAFKSASGKWTQPFKGGWFVSGYGYSGGHPAYDLAPTGGDPTVYAVGEGVVNLTEKRNKAGALDSYGRMATIRHPGGRGSLYAHMAEYAAGLQSGDHVEAGERIGRFGATGNARGAHLHFAISTVGGNPEDYSHGVPKSAIGLAKGGVVTKAIQTVVGEGGDSEAVIPLNRGGVETIAAAIAKYSSQYEAKLSRTAPYAKTVVNNTYMTDSSTKFTGDISVAASTPGELIDALVERKRADNLFDSRSGK